MNDQEIADMRNAIEIAYLEGWMEGNIGNHNVGPADLSGDWAVSDAKLMADNIGEDVDASFYE